MPWDNAIKGGELLSLIETLFASFISPEQACSKTLGSGCLKNQGQSYRLKPVQSAKGTCATHATVEWLWLQEGPIFKQWMPIPKSWLVLHIAMTLLLL